MRYREAERYWHKCYVYYKGIPSYIGAVGDEYVFIRTLSEELKVPIEEFDEVDLTKRVITGFAVYRGRLYRFTPLTIRQWKKGMYMGGDGRVSNTEVHKLNNASGMFEQLHSDNTNLYLNLLSTVGDDVDTEYYHVRGMNFKATLPVKTLRGSLTAYEVVKEKEDGSI